MKQKSQKSIRIWAAVIVMISMVMTAGQSFRTAPVLIVQAASANLESEQTTSVILAIHEKSDLSTILNKKADSYKSSNSKVATVTKNGIVTGVGKGKAVITAKVKNQTVKIQITVYEKRLSASQTNLTIDQKTTIDVTLARRYASEELSAVVSNQEIVEVKTGSFNKTVCPLTLIPKKDGTTTITVYRPKSVEPLIITVTVAQKQELKATELYALCEQSMIELSVKTLDGGTTTGSGFFIGDGMVLTNYHVVSGAKEIKITDYDGVEYEVTGYYDYNEEIDLALLKVKGTKPALQIATETETVGDVIYTIGSPYGFTGSFSKGIISYLNRNVEEHTVRYIQHTAAISKGNSGGPLINRYGEVIGINTLTYTVGQNLNFSVPISYYTILSHQELKPISRFYEEMTKADAK